MEYHSKVDGVFKKDGVSLLGTWKNENHATCDSNAWFYFWSTKNNCMFPLKSHAHSNALMKNVFSSTTYISND